MEVLVIILVVAVFANMMARIVSFAVESKRKQSMRLREIERKRKVAALYGRRDKK